MLEKTALAAQTMKNIGPADTAKNQGKVLHMTKNDRMGGSVPVWKKAQTPQQISEQRLSAAKTGPSDFESVLSYHQRQDLPADSYRQTGGEFGFGDLVDMVNPLHHIPVVGHIYRGVTGDEIKPIGNIVGGAVFGGPLGAASGLVNTIIQEETGRDMAGNAVALVMPREKPGTGPYAHPETRLNQAASHSPADNLPASLLAFTDRGPRSGQPADPVFNLDALPPREPITKLDLKKRDI